MRVSLKMNRGRVLQTIACVGFALLATSCDKQEPAKASAAETGPAPAAVVRDLDANNFKVDHPEQFPLVAAGEHAANEELNVTGVVSPDVSRQVPVPSLATGRVVEINARLGDEVKKGQLLFKVQSTDVDTAYSDYRKAVKNQQLAVENERLTKIQLDRAKLLFDHGAVPQSSVEVANNADIGALTAIENAKVDVETAAAKLHLLGSNPDHPTGIVEVVAPTSGTITDQQITNQSGVQALTPPNPFTISDMSKVWIICDVPENNMAQVRIGEYADVRLTAYPNRVMRARISNILPVIDPTLRTAKVRLEVDNPGILRLGMFVTAVFHGQTSERRATVPAQAVLHLHDRDWVYVPAGGGSFRRIEVVAGAMLPGGMQEIVSGIKSGDQVVSRALVFQSTSEQ
jgi:membrane fusion protein, heavy metal efflux system